MEGLGTLFVLEYLLENLFHRAQVRSKVRKYKRRTTTAGMDLIKLYIT